MALIRPNRIDSELSPGSPRLAGLPPSCARCAHTIKRATCPMRWRSCPCHAAGARGSPRVPAETSARARVAPARSSRILLGRATHPAAARAAGTRRPARMDVCVRAWAYACAHGRASGEARTASAAAGLAQYRGLGTCSVQHTTIHTQRTALCAPSPLGLLSSARTAHTGRLVRKALPPAAAAALVHRCRRPRRHAERYRTQTWLYARVFGRVRLRGRVA